VILAVKGSICIKKLDEHAVRPYSEIVPSGIDFSVHQEFSFINDQLIPDAPKEDRRDPDKYL
jgi:hypothetical protein